MSLFQSEMRVEFHAYHLVFFSVLLLLLCFSSCSSTPPPSHKQIVPPTASSDLVTPGFLTVGSYTAYPPQESIDQQSGNAVGFDIDLISAVASRMNLKTRVISTNYQSVISNLLDRNFDVVISAISITPELQEKVNFVPYFNGGESLLVARGNPLGIEKLMDLCGQRVAVRDATLEQKDLAMQDSACQQAKKAPVKLVAVQDQMTMIQLLMTKKVVATYQDSPLTDYYIKQYPTSFEAGSSVINANLEGIAIRKNDTKMFKSMQSTFDTLKANGTYCSLIKKWGLSSGALMQNNRSIC